MEDYLKKEYSKKWFDMILKNKDKIPKFGIVGFNLNLTDEIVLDNLNEDWDWHVLLKFNKNITIKTKKICQKIKNNIMFPLSYDVIIFTLFGVRFNDNTIKRMTLGEIVEQMNSNILTKGSVGLYYFGMLSSNENLTLKIIKDNLDKPWNWNLLCRNNLEHDCKKYITKCTKNVLLMKILKAKKIS